MRTGRRRNVAETAASESKVPSFPLLSSQVGSSVEFV